MGTSQSLSGPIIGVCDRCLEFVRRDNLAFSHQGVVLCVMCMAKLHAKTVPSGESSPTGAQWAMSMARAA